jgi:hypothetical protein
MFKIIRRDTLNSLHNAIAKLHEDNEANKQHNRKLEIENAHIEFLLGEIEEKHNALAVEAETIRYDLLKYKEATENADKAQVNIHIDDDLQTITPVVRWKNSITKEKLVETGRMKDTDLSNATIQIALMMIVNEALEEVITDFSAPVEED